MAPNDEQSLLIDSLRRVLGEHVRVLETHISFVLLTGTVAYKIKKTVDLGFLDFRTLASRKFYCEEELRLNRRLAPQVYLDVVRITGSFDAPAIEGDGPVIEYAVRMREFDQEALATRVLARGAMQPAFVDELARQVAAFHAAAQATDAGSAHGASEGVLTLALRNFERTRVAVSDPAQLRTLDALRSWTLAEHAAVAPALDKRRARGRVRDCHGDLHLGNVAQVDGRPVIFDCIEFNDALRWIDVFSEVAFLVMDFHRHGRPDLGHRFLDAYLQTTGDYDGLRVLRFHLVYRAMVRAMVASARAMQLAACNASDASAAAECRAYVELAAHYAFEHEPTLVITRGLSGSGKSAGSQSLVETLAGVRIRTDVERKRLHGLRPTDRDPAGVDAAMYAPEETTRVYAYVLSAARVALGAGFNTIVDAAFLQRWQRRMFQDLATEMRVPFVIVAFEAREATLRERVSRRMAQGEDASDAGLAVLAQQLRTHEALDADEAKHAVAIDTDSATAALPVERWRPVLSRLAGLHGAASRARELESMA